MEPVANSVCNVCTVAPSVWQILYEIFMYVVPLRLVWTYYMIHTTDRHLTSLGIQPGHLHPMVHTYLFASRHPLYTDDSYTKKHYSHSKANVRRQARQPWTSNASAVMRLTAKCEPSASLARGFVLGVLILKLWVL